MDAGPITLRAVDRVFEGQGLQVVLRDEPIEVGRAHRLSLEGRGRGHVEQGGQPLAARAGIGAGIAEDEPLAGLADRAMEMPPLLLQPILASGKRCRGGRRHDRSVEEAELGRRSSRPNRARGRGRHRGFHLRQALALGVE